MAVFPKQRSVGEICSKIICMTDFLFLFFAFWFLSLHATTINSHKGTHRIRDSSGQDANNRHLTSAAEQLKYLRWEGLFAWKQRTESKAGPGSCEDEDDGDVGNTTLGTILSHGAELWRTGAVCNSDSKYSSTYSSLSGICVSVYACISVCVRLTQVHIAYAGVTLFVALAASQLHELYVHLVQNMPIQCVYCVDQLQTHKHTLYLDESHFH